MEEMYEYRVFNEDQMKKIAEIDGLVELRNAIFAQLRYDVKRKQFDRGDIDECPEKPTANVAKLRDQYPRADAFLKAFAWYRSASFKKSAFGLQAISRILAGEDYNIVLQDMRKEYAAFNLAQKG